jgi:HK97 family phage prohead protease
MDRIECNARDQVRGADSKMTFSPVTARCSATRRFSTATSSSPGAFAKSIAEAQSQASGRRCCCSTAAWGMSADDMTPAGVWTDLEEDGHGLKVEGKLADTQRGKMHTLLKMDPRPAINGLSIGFIPVKWRMRSSADEPRRTLEEVRLMEVSLVTFPANDKARVLGVNTSRRFFNRGRARAARSAERMRAQGDVAGDDANGGYFLPNPSTVGRVVQEGVRAVADPPDRDVQPISTAALEGMYDNDEGTAATSAKLAARTNTNTPTVGKYRIEAFEIYANPKASQTLLDDAAVDVEAWLAARSRTSSRASRRRSSSTARCVGKIARLRRTRTRWWPPPTLAHLGPDREGQDRRERRLRRIEPGRQAVRPDPGVQARVPAQREVGHAPRGDRQDPQVQGSDDQRVHVATGPAGRQPDTLLGYPIVMAQDMPTLATARCRCGSATGWRRTRSSTARACAPSATTSPTSRTSSSTRPRVGGGVLNFEAIKAMTFEA